MAVTEAAKHYYEKMFPDNNSELLKTDPEFAEFFANFVFDEVPGQNDRRKNSFHGYPCNITWMSRNRGIWRYDVSST